VTASTAAAALQTQPAASATAPTTTGAGAAPVTVPGSSTPTGALGGVGYDPRLAAVQPVQSGQTNISTGTAAVMLATGTQGKTASVTSSGGSPTQTVQTISLDALATKLDVMTSDLVRAASDDLVWVSGEVRAPGAYLAEKDTSLQALIDAAGGTQRQADLSSVEVTSTQIDAETGSSHTIRTIYSAANADFAKVALRPLDSVRVRPVFSDRKGGSVIISGEVRFPGTFDIVRGERLSSVLARAGGLTDQAYPLGAVFTRQSAAIAEADANQRLAKSLESAIVMLSSIPTTTPTTLTYLQSLVQELRTLPAIGRISVTADPVALAVKPEQDVALQPGDTIYIPEHPSTVLVSGEVLNSGSFSYRADLTVDDYVNLAGGETDAAEDSLTFIVLPDGTARPRDSGWISFGSDHIPPGSVVVVPRDPAPFNLTTFLINYSDIISKIALTAASLAVVSGK
jgi:protein involved in polysaccharide export with SLBB domain